MNLLVVAIFLPLLGVAMVWVTAEWGRVAARSIALWTSLATLGFVAPLLLYPVLGQGEPVEIDAPWFANSLVDIRFSLGLDGLSYWMFGLSALLTVTAILVSWEAISERAPAFYCMLLLLESGMLGVFAARDIILFYIFFEFTLIPLFFLIGIWGSEERRYAAIKFFLFTLAGSMLTFLGLLSIVLWNYFHAEPHLLTFSIPALTESLAVHPIDPGWQLWIFLALFAGFAIKVPLFPLHTWLPLAHTQAPTAGSVILAGILLKIGTYGFLRFSIPMLPEATVACMPWILWLSVAGIIYGALVSLAQRDMKKLIAYSSVSHLGFCMLGIFAINPLGVQGGTLQMINHGLSTGGLFALIGMLYERYHTREIAAYGGMARRLPILAFFMVVFTFSSIGLPGLNGFAGEFLLLAGAFQRGYADSPAMWHGQWTTIAVLAVFGVVLGAWYMLWLVERVFFGPLREPANDAHGDHHHPVHDMCLREVLALVPLVVFMVWIGVAPNHFLRPMAGSLDDSIRAAAVSFDKRYDMHTAPATATVLLPPGEGGRRPDEGGAAVGAHAASPSPGRRGDHPLPKGEGFIARGKLARDD
ncbi:MAG TPA: NADH-quinone oxidoreductase subunit M [Pirellulales bacterium]|jgi:NADH-quinone oxidoreductase subunit M|nr:NADH-quinone oxidoreductase subunit M [Pirellulales bacterium]